MNCRGCRILWILVSVLASLPTGAHAERLPIKTYTTGDGLAHNDIRRIVKDSRGFLWFCTADGLSRFDGYGFTNFGVSDGLPHPSVNDLLETRKGEYWIATEGGLVRFAPAEERKFTVIASPRDDIRTRFITSLHETREGAIWVGTRNGLYRLKPNGAFSLYAVDIGLPGDYPEQRWISDILDDAKGTLWIATPNGLYRRSPDESTKRYTIREGLPDDFLHDLLEDRDGRIWVASRYAGFFRLNGSGAAGVPLADIRLSQGPPVNWIYRLFESADRQLWAATARGLAQYSPAGAPGLVQRFGFREGLTHHEITAMAEDPAGNLWLGTSSAGAMKITPQGFSMFGEHEYISGVHAIFEDNAGNVCVRGVVFGDAGRSVFDGARLDPLNPQWFGVHVRFGCFDGDRFQWFWPGSVALLGWVQEQVTLRSRAGEWWLGTGEGLFRFAAVDSFLALKTARPAAVYTPRNKRPASQIQRLFEDSRGNVWVSTISVPSRVERWEPARSRWRDLSKAPGLAALQDRWAARAFGEDAQGNVWVGFDGELARFRDSDSDFDLYTVKSGLPPGKIRDIHRDRSGRLWFASSHSGLVRVDNTGSTTPTFVTYTTAQGLSSNNAMTITEDTFGRLYVGGGRGLDRLDPVKGRVKHFTTVDGLPAAIIVDAFRDRHGTLWFGTTAGLARFRPSPETSQPPPPVLITAVRRRGVPLLVSALGERHLTYPSFHPSQNQLQIEFLGLSFSSGDVLRYQYTLEGAGGGWSPPSEERAVTFASLSPGRYRFLVRAVNSDGLASTDPASVTFTVLVPLWRRPWFLAVLLASASLIAVSFYRSRINRVIEMARVRTRIATDLHDDIGANLTRIALLSEAGKAHDPQDGPLDAIARIARESVSSMSDIVWSVNPKRETLNDLVRRMRQHADEVFTQRGTELCFSAPGAADHVKLRMEVRRDLLLVFKEIVNNAVRHSRCSAVAIDLTLHRTRLVLRIADNGVGFDASADHDGHGMTSLRRRADALKGSIEVVSGATGTTVTLDVPL